MANTATRKSKENVSTVTILGSGTSFGDFDLHPFKSNFDMAPTELCSSSDIGLSQTFLSQSHGEAKSKYKRQDSALEQEEIDCWKRGIDYKMMMR